MFAPSVEWEPLGLSKAKDLNEKPQAKKVLLVHCAYLQKGGEDRVVEQEGALLETYYRVVRFIRSNEELLVLNRFQQVLKLLWNRAICRDLQDFLQQHEPDIVHVHNTFPLFSPAIFHTLGRWKRRCQKQGETKRLVMTVHNFRLHCPQGTLMRPKRWVRLLRGVHSKRWVRPKLMAQKQILSSELCQRCFASGNFIPAIRARCYRGSVTMTAAIALMLAWHKRLGTWRKNVDRFLYLDETQRTLLTRVGFPDEKFIRKPNSIADDWVASPASPQGEVLRLLFVGRLSEEKGLRILLNAMQNLRNSCEVARPIKLCIAGDGPLREELENFIAHFAQIQDGMSIQYRGQLERGALHQTMGASHFLILPSVWYEGMPITILESLASGRPVISFRLGASGKILAGRTCGILAPFFKDATAEQNLDLEQTYSHEDLVRNLSLAIREAGEVVSETQRYEQMCSAARSRFEKNYTAKQNLQALRAVYEN
ncbi:MAG: glycosyltransferase family 4 protein [Spirochaetota bacterium]